MRRALPLALAATGLLLASIVGLRLTIATPAAALTNCDVTDADLDASEQQLLQLLNVARAQVGAVALTPSAALNRAAAWKSGDPSAGGAGFSHTDSLGRAYDKRLRDCGYTGSSGENVGYGTSSADAIFNLWMESPGHRANILNPSYRAVGIGRRTIYWTLDFGSVLDTSSGAPPTSAAVLPSATPTRTPTPMSTPTTIPTAAPTATPTTPAGAQQAGPWRVVIPMLGGGF